MEQHKHTGKVALIDKAAGFVYHLFMLESSVSVNKTEKHTQRPKMAMTAVKEGLAMKQRSSVDYKYMSLFGQFCFTHRSGSMA